jgi:hypothetical protein
MGKRLDHLSDTQQRIYREVLAEVVRDGRTVRDVLPLVDASKEDRAAVADEFCAGAGAGYLS